MHLHYTPTYSSWLNQVEIWFGMITSQCIRRGTFTSVRDLIRRINSYIQGYNQNARPFTWTYRNERKRICVPLSSLSGHYKPSHKSRSCFPLAFVLVLDFQKISRKRRRTITTKIGTVYEMAPSLP